MGGVRHWTCRAAPTHPPWAGAAGKSFSMVGIGLQATAAAATTTTTASSCPVIYGTETDLYHVDQTYDTLLRTAIGRMAHQAPRRCCAVQSSFGRYPGAVQCAAQS